VLGVLTRALAVVEMREDAFDHRRIFNGDNDLHLLVDTGGVPEWLLQGALRRP